MKVLKKITVLFILSLFILTSIEHVAMAEEKGTGVENKLSDTDRKSVV